MKKKRIPRYSPYYKAVGKAVDYILDVREGLIKPVKTKRPWLDDVFPVLNRSVITIAAGSGVGKSYELMRLMDNVLDKEVNPSSDKYRWLNFSLEMKVESLVLRSLSKDMKKEKSSILYGDLSDEELDLFEELVDKMEEDERAYILQEPTSPDQFLSDCEDFLEEFKDAESCFISIDHLALFRSDNGEPRNQIIESVIMNINDLKLKYPNVIFIILSQLNRDREKRLMDKNIMAQPKNSDLYYSEFTFQISDYVYIMVNPYRDKLAEYSYVIADMYPHLEEFFMEVDDKGRTSLETIGVVYYHIMKFRDADNGDYIDLYAEKLPIKNRDLLIEQRDKDKKKKATAVFDKKLGKVVKAEDSTTQRVDKKPKLTSKLFGDLPETSGEEVPANFDLKGAFDPPEPPKEKTTRAPGTTGGGSSNLPF